MRDVCVFFTSLNGTKKEIRDIALPEFIAMKNTTKENFDYKVTSSGAIVFTFENGGKVIDYGYKVVATEKGQEFADRFTYKVNKENSRKLY